MPSEILAIVSDDFNLGFKLTGIDTYGCLSDTQAKEYVEKELTQPRYRLILIDENFLLSFDARLKKKINESSLPLVMAIPLRKDFKETIETKDYFLKMVQEAIGYEIRIQ